MLCSTADLRYRDTRTVCIIVVINCFNVALITYDYYNSRVSAWYEHKDGTVLVLYSLVNTGTWLQYCTADMFQSQTDQAKVWFIYIQDLWLGSAWSLAHKDRDTVALRQERTRIPTRDPDIAVFQFEFTSIIMPCLQVLFNYCAINTRRQCCSPWLSTARLGHISFFSFKALPSNNCRMNSYTDTATTYKYSAPRTGTIKTESCARNQLKTNSYARTSLGFLWWTKLNVMMAAK